MSEPFSSTVACCIGTVRGTLTSTSASPPVTMLAGLESTRIVKSVVVSAVETGALPSAQTQASAAQVNLLMYPSPFTRGGRATMAGLRTSGKPDGCAEWW